MPLPPKPSALEALDCAIREAQRNARLRDIYAVLANADFIDVLKSEALKITTVSENGPHGPSGHEVPFRYQGIPILYSPILPDTQVIAMLANGSWQRMHVGDWK